MNSFRLSLCLWYQLGNIGVTGYIVAQIYKLGEDFRVHLNSYDVLDKLRYSFQSTGTVGGLL